MRQQRIILSSRPTRKKPSATKGTLIARSIAICLAAVMLGPARPAAADNCSIFDDGGDTGIWVCDPLPPLCDGCTEPGAVGDKAAFTFKESPASRDIRAVVQTIKIHHLPADWIPAVLLSGLNVWRAGQDLANTYLQGDHHINDDTVRDYGHDNAPSPQDARPETPPEAARNTGPEVDPSTVEASNTDSPDGGLDPVNPWNGEFVIQETDLQFPGYGVPFALVRTYRSRIDYNGPLGFGWDHSFNRRLLPTTGDASCNGMLYMTGNGQSVRFKEASRTTTQTSATTSATEVVYQAPPGLHYDLRGHGISWTLIFDNTPVTLHAFAYALKSPDGLTAMFNDAGLLATLSDATDHGLTVAWESDGPPELGAIH